MQSRTGEADEGMSNKQRRSWKHKGDARDGKGKMGAAQTTETKDGNKKTERAL